MNTLILLVYIATGCFHCDAYVDTVHRATIAASVDNCCEIRTVNVVEEPPYQVRQITKIPTVIMVDEMGSEQGRILGYTSVTTLVDWIKYTAPDNSI